MMALLKFVIEVTFLLSVISAVWLALVVLG